MSTKASVAPALHSTAAAAMAAVACLLLRPAGDEGVAWLAFLQEPMLCLLRNMYKTVM